MYEGPAVNLSKDVIKRMWSRGAQEVFRYAAANNLSTTAVYEALKHQSLYASGDIKSIAQSALSKVDKTWAKAAEEASKAVVKQSARASAGRGAIRQVVARALPYVGPIVILIMLGLGVYIASGQLGRFFADDSTRGGWRTRIDSDESLSRNEKTPTAKPIEDTETGSFLPGSPPPKDATVLSRQTWGDISAAVATRRPGTIVDLIILDTTAGLGGEVHYFDSSGKETQAVLQVVEEGESYQISYETIEGIVRGTLTIDDNTGALTGELAMPGSLGGARQTELSMKRQ